MKKTTQKKKIKKVKAWAIIIDDSFKETEKGCLEYADVLVNNECPSVEPTDALAIYKKRKDARYHLLPNRKIIPCEITYKI